MEISWKARRRGTIFCAPACGRGCTYEEYVLANDQAGKLAKRLGKGWRKRVWENLGWHYSVISPCKRIKVYPNISSYSAFLGDTDSVGGRWVEHGKTPETAIKNVVRSAKAELKKISATISGL